MSAFSRALACFRSPSVWLAIAVLLVNDHVLKAAHPSWLTGKLSDVAGLYFFPFLVLLAVGPLLDRAGERPRASGLFAFIATALGFVLIKVQPMANALAEQVLGAPFGGRAAIAMDPTDLLALAAVAPAWLLWRNSLATPRPGLTHADRWKAAVAIGLASLATLATSPSSYCAVERLMVVDSTLYALSVSCPGITVAAFNEGTRQWDEVWRGDSGRVEASARVPGAIKAIIADYRPVPLPLVECLPAEPQTCYRIDGFARVEKSADGGRSWHVDWQVPADRIPVMRRLQPGIDAVDLASYDLEMQSLEDGGHRVVVAMGSEGVLMREPDGEWERRAVLSAEPAPYAASTAPQIARVLNLEVILWVTATLLALCVLYVLAWRDLGRLWAVALLAAVLLLASFMALQVLPFLGPPDAWLAFIGLATGGLLLAWAGKADQSERPEMARRAGCLWTLTGLGVLLSSFPLVLWAVGVIAVYEVALVMAVALALVVVFWGGRWVLRMM
jgi:hypothetical protein